MRSIFKKGCIVAERLEKSGILGTQAYWKTLKDLYLEEPKHREIGRFHALRGWLEFNLNKKLKGERTPIDGLFAKNGL